MFSFLCSLVSRGLPRNPAERMGQSPLFDPNVILLVSDFRCMCTPIQECGRECKCTEWLANLPTFVAHAPAPLIKLALEREIFPLYLYDFFRRRFDLISYTRRPVTRAHPASTNGVVLTLNEDASWQVTIMDLSTGKTHTREVKDVSKALTEKQWDSIRPRRLLVRSGTKRKWTGDVEQFRKRFKCDERCLICRHDNMQI
jgi:hypothetical protein